MLQNVLAMVESNHAGMPSVLVVVGDEDYRDFLCDALTFYNIKVTGIIYQTNWLDSVHAEQYDLLITDVYIDRKNKYPQISKMKGDPKYAHLHIILLTSFTMNEDLIEEYNSCTILTIPFELRDLIILINGHSSGKSMPALLQ